MIKEAYCSYEVSKLLKEKGFDELCLKNYMNVDKELHNWGWELSYGTNRRNNANTRNCAAPTHQMAMAWLREVHNIEICISIGLWGKNNVKRYSWSPVIVHTDWLEYPLTLPDGSCSDVADSYNKAVEAALKYILKNLI